MHSGQPCKDSPGETRQDSKRRTANIEYSDRIDGQERTGGQEKGQPVLGSRRGQRRARTGQPGKAHPGQDSRVRTDRTGQSEHKRNARKARDRRAADRTAARDRTAGTGQPGLDIRDRTPRTRQLGTGYPDRSA